MEQSLLEEASLQHARGPPLAPSKTDFSPLAMPLDPSFFSNPVSERKGWLRKVGEQRRVPIFLPFSFSHGWEALNVKLGTSQTQSFAQLKKQHIFLRQGCQSL